MYCSRYLSQHPVDHDDHGPHQLEAPAEEEEVRTRAGHDGCAKNLKGLRHEIDLKKFDKNGQIYA